MSDQLLPFLRFGPKQMQRQGEYKAAVDMFAREYAQAVLDEDEFMRGHYLDEVAATLILINGDSIDRRKLEIELTHAAEHACAEVGLTNFSADLASDVEVAIQKRYQR